MAEADKKSIDGAIERHLPGLRAFVRLRVGPELRAYESCSDLVQSVCRELVEDWPELSFDNDAALRSWLFTTALHKVQHLARDIHRDKRDVRRIVGGTVGAELAADYAALGTPSANAMTQEQVERLEAAFDRLTDDHREVITLARIASLPLLEVGARMGGRSQGAVTMLLGRALSALGRELGEPAA